MAGPLSLSFGITADPGDADAALKLLQKDMAQVGTQAATTSQSLALIPTQTSAATKGALALNTSLTDLSRQGLQSLYSGLGPAGQALEALTAGFGPLGIAIGAVTAGLALAGKGWLDLAESTQAAARASNLSAEAISGLRVAAATGGTSVEALSQAFVRMQRAAVEGSNEAVAALAFFGLTPADVIDDLEGSINRLIKRFNDLGPSAERTTHLIALLGRSATDLVPALEDAEGGLDGLIKKARELGVLMTEENIKAADKFGDQMDILVLQLKGVAAQIGSVVIPVLDRLNQKFLDAQRGVARFGPGNLIRNLRTDIDKIAGGIPAAPDLGLGRGLTPQAMAALEQSTAAFAKAAPKAKTGARDLNHEISETEKIAKANAAAWAKYQDTARELNPILRTLTTVSDDLNASIIKQRLALKPTSDTVEEFVTAAEKAGFSTAYIQKKFDEFFTRADAYAATAAVLRDHISTLAEAMTAAGKAAAGGIPGAGAQAPGEAIPGVKPGEIIPPSVEESNKEALARLAVQFQVFGDVLGTVFNTIGAAAQASFEAFILTGQAGGMAFKKLAAQIIAALAIQSAVKAIFEVAEGFAASAMAPFDPTAALRAALHFKAAKMYGIVAGVAGAAGLAIGAAGGLGGQGAGAGGEFGGETTPGDVYIGGTGASIGRRREEMLVEALDANTRVMNRLEGTPAGTVATWAGEQNPVVFTTAAAEGAARDSGAGRLLLANAGVGN